MIIIRPRSEVALIVTRETSSQVTKAAHELLRAEKWDREFAHIGPQEKIWRILLELYIAAENRGGLTVKSIWLGSGLPTGLPVLIASITCWRSNMVACVPCPDTAEMKPLRP
jgi:hypothetical protein